jgi:hypothetical protein
MPSSPTRLLFARPLVVGVFLLALLPFAGLMAFAQPAIDDYDNAATVARLGRWGAQWYWYTHWSGRFVAIGVSTLANPLSYGPRPGVEPTGLWALRGMLLLLGGALLLATQQVLRAVQLVLAGAGPRPTRRGSGALALAVVVLALNALSEPFSLLYWYSGAVNYVLPLVLTLGFAAAALRALGLPPGAAGRRAWSLAATMCLVGAVGGGEVALLACGVLLAGLGAWRGWGLARPAPNRKLWLLWVGCFLLTAAALAGAPGNRQRHGMANPDAAGPYHRWLLLAPRTVLTAARMAARPPVAGAALVLGAAVLLSGTGPRRPRPGRRELLLVLAGYALLNAVGVAFLKAFFMRDMWVEAMPGRVVNVLVVQLLVSTAALALWGQAWLPAGPGWWRGRAVPPVLAGLALLLLLTGQARQAWQELLFMAPDYARQMHARYALLDAAHRRGAAEAVLPPLQLPDARGLLAPIPAAAQRADVHVELFEDAAQKNNLFLANYYHLPRVRLAGPAPTR